MDAKWNGDKLRIRRKQLGFTMKQLATLVGCTRPLISIWEDNKSAPTGHYLVLLGMALNMEPKELYLINNQEEGGSDDNVE